MSTADEFLGAYDAQLRDERETPDALGIHRLGPLRIAALAGGRRFISYRSLAADDGTPADVPSVRALVDAAAEHLRADVAATEAEWKTRGHDHAPGLHEALCEHGFVAEDPESIMIGEARLLAVEVPLPDEVTLRRITDEADVRAMCAMADEVFGNPLDDRHAEDILRRQRQDPTMELWVAEADGVETEGVETEGVETDRIIVSAGRLEPVDGTDFAGIWGGCTRPEWRGRGIYRALTAARARSAIRAGKRYLNSDSTEYSRPILQRSGFFRVSTTTPYVWRR